MLAASEAQPVEVILLFIEHKIRKLNSSNCCTPVLRLCCKGQSQSADTPTSELDGSVHVQRVGNC